MPDSAIVVPQEALARQRAVRFIVLVGLVSLFSDMTYESARSINGPFLATLGASATLVGVVAGLGEFIGYGVRLGSGIYADRSHRYWSVTIGGYVLNLVAVPLMALAGSWQLAAVLIVLERMGRAIRSPARDAMLSHAASRTGLGWGFGLHEALDQIGAVTGPVVLVAMLGLGQGYRAAYALLAAPAVCAIALLLGARRRAASTRSGSGIFRPAGGGERFFQAILVVRGGRIAGGRRVHRLSVDRLSFQQDRWARPRLDAGPLRLGHGDGRHCRTGAGRLVRARRDLGADRHDLPVRAGLPVGVSRRAAGSNRGDGILGHRDGGAGIGHARGGRRAHPAGATRHGLRHVQCLLRQRLVRGQCVVGVVVRSLGVGHRLLRRRRAIGGHPRVAVVGPANHGHLTRPVR